MKIKEILESLELSVVCPGDGKREIEGVVVGDLLSHVLGEARENWAWVTIQIHMNVSAVAVLKDLPLVLLASGRMPQDDLVAKCREEGITLAVSPLSAYGLCCRLCGMGIGDA